MQFATWLRLCDFQPTQLADGTWPRALTLDIFDSRFYGHQIRKRPRHHRLPARPFLIVGPLVVSRRRKPASARIAPKSAQRRPLRRVMGRGPHP